jgi:hypothetical protein
VIEAFNRSLTLQTGDIRVFSHKDAVLYQKCSKYEGMQNLKANQKKNDGVLSKVC